MKKMRFLSVVSCALLLFASTTSYAQKRESDRSCTDRDRQSRNEKPDKPDKADKPDKSNKQEKPDKPSIGDIIDRFVDDGFRPFGKNNQ